MTRSVAGFRFGAVAAGLKASGRPDFALLLAESEVPLAAVFTRSRIKGAPVVLSQERGKSGLCRGVVVHSGIANAFTGRAGLEDEQEVVRAVAEATGADERRLLAENASGNGLPLSAMVKDDEKCIRCGLCAVRCPTDAITMERLAGHEPWEVTHP